MVLVKQIFSLYGSKFRKLTILLSCVFENCTYNVSHYIFYSLIVNIMLLFVMFVMLFICCI